MGEIKGNISIRKIDVEAIHVIKSLWKELNDYHVTCSKEFKACFQNNSFEERVEKLLKKNKLRLDGAFDSYQVIGYCISSINNNQGEIDSVYVMPSYRGLNIGNKLIDTHLLWFKKEKVDDIKIIVASGNETVINFYKKYGFIIRKYELRRIFKINNKNG